MYLSLAIDCFDREPAAWSVSRHPDSELVGSSLRSYLAKRPEGMGARAEGFFGTLKEEFCNGRDWSRVGFDEFGKRLDAYIEWCVSGRLKEFDEGCRKTYDTIAGRRRRLGYTA